MNLLKSLPIQLILSILAAFYLGTRLDASIVSWLYTASNCFIECLLFVLPFMVFSLIYLALSNAEQNSLKWLLVIFGGVFVSNVTALFTAYGFSAMALPLIGISTTSELFAPNASAITARFSLNLPQLIGTDKAMLLALVVGILFARLPATNRLKMKMQSAVTVMNHWINFIINRVFIPLLPLYVFGFCMKLSYDEALTHLFSSFGKVFLVSMLLVAAYIFMLYFWAAGGNLARARLFLKNMMPAGLTAFSTMSSAATMPLTLSCTEKNTQDPQITRLTIPSTSNIHMLGDDLTIVMTAMAIMTMFGMPFPDFVAFSLFASAFSIAKLSCVGVPGASVLVILPVLQNYLHFSPEMITVLTTIYILQDSFGTTANVLGNGAFTLLIQRLLRRFSATNPIK